MTLRPIPGSRLYRDLCAECLDPIRVASNDETNKNYCLACQFPDRKPPGKGTRLTPRQQAGSAKTN